MMEFKCFRVDEPFLNLHMESQSHADSRSSCYHSPCSAYSSPTSPTNTSSSSSLLEICITVHSSGIAGVFRIFPWFFSSFINQLNCHCLREAPPEQPIKSCPFLYPCWSFVSALVLSFSEIFFFQPFNCLFPSSSLGFKFHENRDFVYFATYPVPGTVVDT